MVELQKYNHWILKGHKMINYSKEFERGVLNTFRVTRV